LPLESLVSPLVGVVRGMQEALAGPEDARMAAAWCETAFPRTLVGGGSGPSLRDARAAAIGEAVERYSAGIVDPGACVVATARELGADAVDPSRFALFSARQYASAGFRYRRFDRDTRLAWIEGVSLPGGARAWLPAQLVHLAGHEDEQPLCRTTSSGLACHETAEGATVAALLELLERDAFMITWKARISWPLLDWRDDEQLVSFEETFLRPTGLHWSAVDLSAFWDVPIVAAVIRGGSTLGVGAAAATTVRHAVMKALDEATRVRTWARALRAAGTEAPAAEDVEELDDHVRFYADPCNASKLDFLDESPRRRRVAGVEPVDDGIEGLCRRLARRNATSYAVDVTSPDIREAGLAVVRVVAPELCALDVEHTAQLLGARRLYEFASGDLNPDPHPFP
jgi:ribosomal protein S12 methylthiotransferase accessory factor